MDEVRLRGEAVFRELGCADRGREGGVLEVGCGLRANANGERQSQPNQLVPGLVVVESPWSPPVDSANASLEVALTLSSKASEASRRLQLAWSNGQWRLMAMWIPTVPQTTPSLTEGGWPASWHIRRRRSILCLSTSLGLLRRRRVSLLKPLLLENS